MTRFVPEGEPGIPLSRVRYSNLNQDLKDRIAATDPTEHELLEMIVIQQKINNLQRTYLSGKVIDEDDIDWPLTL